MALGASSSSTIITDDAELNRVTILNNKEMSLYNSGRFNESLDYFDKALSIDPKNVAVLFHKANAIAGLGNYTRAITYYDRMLTLDPKNVAALDN